MRLIRPISSLFPVQKRSGSRNQWVLSAGLALLYLSCTMAFALPIPLVQVESILGGFSSGTGTGGFETGPGLPDVERATIRFIYNPNAGDSNPDPLINQFDNAVIGFDMVVKQSTRPDLHFVSGVGNLTVITDYAYRVSFRITGATETSGAYADPFTFVFNTIKERSLPPVALEMPLLDYWNQWPRAFGLVGGTVGPSPVAVNETDWATGFNAQFLSAVSVPEPSPLLLFLLGLPAFWLVRRRRLSDQDAAARDY